MVGNRTYIFWLWWKACWYFFSPGVLVVSGASHLWFASPCRNTLISFPIKCRSIFKLLNSTIEFCGVFWVILLWSLICDPPAYWTVQFPVWGLALGWCMVAAVLMWIPAVAAYRTQAKGSFLKVGMMPVRAKGAFYWWLQLYSSISVADMAPPFTAFEDAMLS